MQKRDFRGVLPAITTKLNPDQSVDLPGVAADVAFQIEGGVDAVIVCGSLGEASSLSARKSWRSPRTAIAAAAVVCRCS